MPRKAAGQLGAVVSIHSFTPVYRDVPRPWQIGLIFDRDERYARSVEAGLKQDPALIVGMNEPYSPADRVFHTLERHAERRGLPPLMIEIRNDLIRTEDGQASWANRLAPLLREGARTLAHRAEKWIRFPTNDAPLEKKSIDVQVPLLVHAHDGHGA